MVNIYAEKGYLGLILECKGQRHTNVNGKDGKKLNYVQPQPDRSKKGDKKVSEPSGVSKRDARQEACFFSLIQEMPS